MCKISLLRVTYGSYCITNTKINVLWSHVEKENKTKNATERNLLWQEERMLYLNDKKKVVIWRSVFHGEPYGKQKWIKIKTNLARCCRCTGHPAGNWDLSRNGLLGAPADTSGKGRFMCFNKFNKSSEILTKNCSLSRYECLKCCMTLNGFRLLIYTSVF